MRGGIEGYTLEWDGLVYFIPKSTLGAGIAEIVKIPDGIYLGGAWSKHTAEFLPFMPYGHQLSDSLLKEFFVVHATYLLTVDSAE